MLALVLRLFYRGQKLYMYEISLFVISVVSNVTEIPTGKFCMREKLREHVTYTIYAIIGTFELWSLAISKW